LAVPLVTSFAVAGVSPPALLIGVAAVAGFLAHEALLVILGRRGTRIQRERSRPAAVWLTAASATALGAWLVAAWSVPAALRWSFLLPLVPAAFLAGSIAGKREKSLQGETAVALAFSVLSVPLCLAAGSSIGTAAAVASVFASIFVAGTLAVRIVVLQVRSGGNATAVRSARIAALALIAMNVLLLMAAASYALVPYSTPIAAAPGLLVAAWISASPPHSTQLRSVGWTLVATSAAAALILCGTRLV